MTDTDKLKRLAEAWAACEPMPTLYNTADDGKDILALIAENERLDGIARQLTRTAYDARKQRDEAVTLLQKVFAQDLSSVDDDVVLALANFIDSVSGKEPSTE